MLKFVHVCYSLEKVMGVMRRNAKDENRRIANLETRLPYILFIYEGFWSPRITFSFGAISIESAVRDALQHKGYALIIVAIEDYGGDPSAIPPQYFAPRL